MINWLKNKVITLAGDITDKREPFKELTRELPIKGTGLSYAERARMFESDLLERFLLPNGVYAYRIHEEPLVIGDQALWHGIATAMWAFKYAALKTAMVERILLDSVKAMSCHFPGPAHTLIRGVDPLTAGETSRMADDASNDTATGVLAGAYFAWLHGTEEVRAEAKWILSCLAGELLANHYQLVRQDGTPTTYGRLVDGFKTDPLRVSLAMAIFMAAYGATLEKRYLDASAELANKYRALLKTPVFKFLWLTKSHEAHRAAIHLTIIADLADNKTKAAALDGLEAIAWLERKAANPWILALISRHLALDPDERHIYRGRQLEYEPSERGPDTEKLNSNRAEWWAKFGVGFVKWGDNIRATQALPYWMLASQDFFPQRHPFMADGWIGAKVPSGYHSGLDFLVAHWLGVTTGLVGKDE